MDFWSLKYTISGIIECFTGRCIDFPWTCNMYNGVVAPESGVQATMSNEVINIAEFVLENRKKKN
mgnify:CR=1 FL=1